MGKRNTLLGGRAAFRILDGKRRLYMLGIGGVSMSALALLVQSRGCSVSGEDRLTDSKTVGMLMGRGIPVWSEWHGLPIECDALIYSAAIGEENPAFSQAAARGIPILSRSDLLAAEMQRYPCRITVAGIHGKSTVCSMIDAILTHAGKDPTTVSGATLTNHSTLRLGTGDIFLAEACEYTDSFLSLSPTVAVALNLEHDHPDYFRDEDAVASSFAKYLSACTGVAVIPSSGRLPSLVPTGTSCVRFGDGGMLSASDIREGSDGLSFTLLEDGRSAGCCRLPLIGVYQVQNALAAMLTAMQCGVPLALSAEALSGFFSPDRRCQGRIAQNGVAWYEDYAHHPSEIRAILSALRAHTRGRLVCAFEAHTYSRLHTLREGFLAALRLADEAVVLPIYAARETDTLGESAERLAEELGARCFAAYEDAAEYLKESTAAGDTVAVLGAGRAGELIRYL